MPKSLNIFHLYCYYILCNRALNISHNNIIQIFNEQFKELYNSSHLSKHD